MSLYKHFLTVVMAATLTSVAMTNHVYAEEEFTISITGPDGETMAPRAAQPVRPAQPVRTAPAANRATAQTQAPATAPATNAQGTQPRTPAATAPATTPAAGTALAANQGAANQGAANQGTTPAGTTPAGATTGAPTTHTVQPRETIWSIAHRYSAPYNDVNEFQAVASIYRNNRAAFEDSDVNRIRRGANLTIPSHDAMALEQTQTGSDLLSRGITDLPPLPTRLAANQTGQTGAQASGANAQATATATAQTGTGTPATSGNAQALAQNQATPPAAGEMTPTIPTFTARETMLRDANPVWVAPEGSFDDYTKEVLTDDQLAEQNANKTQEYVPEITRSSMDLQAIEQLLDKTERNIQTAQKDIYKRLDDNIQRSAQVARETATVTAQEEVADLINHYEQVIAELQQSNNDLRANLSRINKQVEQIRGIQLETADSMAELDRRLGADPLTGAATSSSSNSFQSGPIMWVLLIIGAIAFLLSIGLFIFKSRMRRERAMASSYDDDSGDFMDEEDIEISNLLAKANLAAEHDQAAQKQAEQQAQEQEQQQAQPAPQQASAAPASALDDSFDAGFDGSLGDFGADAPNTPAPAPAPVSKMPEFHDQLEIPEFPSSNATPGVAPAPKSPGPTGASLAAAAAGGALAGGAMAGGALAGGAMAGSALAGGAMAGGAALAASPEAEAQAAWDSAAGGSGTSSLEKSAANAAGDSWAQALGDQEAGASQVDLGDGGFGDAGGDFGGAGGDFGGDAGGFGDAGGDFGGAGGDFGGDAGGFGGDAGSFGAADDGFGGGDLGAASTDNGGFGAADDGFGADAGGDFGAASGDAGAFGANDDGFGGDAAGGDFGSDAGGDFGAAGGDFGGAGGDFGAAGGDFGGDTGGFGDAPADAASGDSAGFGAADDGFGGDTGGFDAAPSAGASGDTDAFGDLGGDAGGFGDLGGDTGGAFGGAADDGGFGGDAGGFGDSAAGGDFGSDAGGFGDLGGDAGGFGDDSGGFGDGGDFGGDAGGFGDLGADASGDFGNGGFDDMDLAGDDAKQFAQSMQNAGSGNFPKTEALAPEVNETSAKSDDHTPQAPAADVSTVLAQEAPVEDKVQHESHEQPADANAALSAAVGAGLAAAATAALAQDGAKQDEAHQAPESKKQELTELDAKQPASDEELPLDPALAQALSGDSIPSDAELKQEEPALSNVFDNLVDGKKPDEILAETPEGKNLDSVYDRFFTEDGAVAPEVEEAAEEVSSYLDPESQPELADGLYLPPEGLANETEHSDVAPQSDEEKSLAAAFGAEPSDADKAMADAFGAEPSDADKAMAAAFGAEPSDADKAMADAFGAEPSDADKAMADAFGAEPSDADKAMADAFGAEPSDADKAMADAFGAEPSDADKAMADAFGAEPSDADKAMADAFGAEPSDADLAMADAFGAEPSDADLAMADAFGAEPQSDLGAGITDLSGELDAVESETTPDLADTEFAGFNLGDAQDDELPSLDAGLKNLGAAAQPEDEESSLSQALAQASAQRAEHQAEPLADSLAEPDAVGATELESLQDTFNVPEDSAQEIAREAVPQTATQEAKDLADVLGTSLEHADLKEAEAQLGAAAQPDSDALMSADETFGEHGVDLEEAPDFVDLSHEDNVIPGDNSLQGQDFKAFDLGASDDEASDAAQNRNDIFGTDGDAAVSDDELFGHTDSGKGDWEHGFNHFDEPVDDSEDHDFVNFANNLHRQEALAADEAADFKGIHEYDTDHDLELSSAEDALAVPEDQELNSGSTADHFDADASNALLDSIEQGAESAENGASAESAASAPEIQPEESFPELAADEPESSESAVDDLLGDIKSEELDHELAEQDLDGLSSYDATTPYFDTADEDNNLIMPSAEEMAQSEPASDLGELAPEFDETAAQTAPTEEALSDALPAEDAAAAEALADETLADAAPLAAEDAVLPTHDILDDVSAHTNDLDADISADEDLKGLSSYDKDEQYTQHNAETDLILPDSEESTEPTEVPTLDDLDSADLETALDNLNIPDGASEFESGVAPDATLEADAGVEPDAGVEADAGVEPEAAMAESVATEDSVPDASAAGVDVEPATELETEHAHAVEEPFINVADAEVAPGSETAAPIEPEQSDTVEDVSASESELEPSMWSVPSDEDFDLPHVSGVSAADLEPAAIADGEVVAEEPVAEADNADLSAAGFTTHDLADLETPPAEDSDAEALAPELETSAFEAEPEVPAFDAGLGAGLDAESAADLGADFASEIDKDLDSGSANWPEPDLDVGDSDDELFSSRIGSADALADMLNDVPADIPEEVVRQSGSHIEADAEPLNLAADTSAPAAEPAENEQAEAESSAAEPSIEEALAQAPSADSSGAAAEAIVGDMVAGSGSDDELLGADLGLDHDAAAAQSDELMGSMMAEPEAASTAESGDFGADLGAELGDLGADNNDFGTEPSDLGAELGDLGAEPSDLGAADFDFDALGSGAELDGLSTGPETDVISEADALDEGDLGAADFDFDALGDLDQSGDGDLGAFGDLDADGFDLGADTSATEGDFSDLGSLGDDPSALDGLDGLDSLDTAALEGLDFDEPKPTPKA